ncbi:MAG: DUF6125 family protein [Syntrophorhabdaceae bacterium]|nr:DUF6125 family protein [Syntrophorhabdaceae bacterium]
MAIPSLDLMDQKQKDAFLELVLWHYKAVDGFWFLHVSGAFGQAAAENVVEKVWEDASRLASREIVKRFDIKEKGLKGFARAIALFPMATLVGYDITPEYGALTISVPHCSAQEARLKHGLGEFKCKEMHRRLFEAFAKEIDPSIQTQCIHAPPDPHPADMFCKWRFTI